MSWNQSSSSINMDENTHETFQVVNILILFGIVFVFQYTLTFLTNNPLLIFILSLGILFGSNVNIFLFRMQKISNYYYSDPSMYTWWQQIFKMFIPETVNTDVYINIAGGFIPIVISAIFVISNPDIIFLSILLSILLIVIINKLALTTKYGVVLPLFTLPLLGLLGGLTISAIYFIFGIQIIITKIAMIAYTSITISTLIGADLLNLGKFFNYRSNGISIGGAGIYDGIFLAGLLTLVFILF